MGSNVDTINFVTPGNVTGLVSAKGDLITSTDGSGLTNLAVGTDGNVLTSDSGQANGLAWVAPSSLGTSTADEGAQAQRSGSQTITTAVTTTVIYNSVQSDPQSNYNSTTGEYTAPSTGFYAATASVNWDANATDSRLLFIRVNGSTIARSDLTDVLLSGSDTNPHAVAAAFFPMTSGDILDVAVLQQTGSNRTIGNQGGVSNQLCVAFLGT